MKLSHKLCGAALLAVAGVALVVPNTTKAADDDSKTGTGHIGFTSTVDTDITDPGSSDGTKIYPSDTEDPGEFGMIVVTPLEFGNHSVVGAETDKSYDVTKYTVATDGDDKEMQHFVSYQDYRAQEDHSYTLSANISSGFASTEGNYLKGAKLTYSNLWLANKNLTVTDNPTPEASVALDSADTAAGVGASKVFVNNTATTGVGYGRYTLNFGSADAANIESSIVLDVTNSGNIAKGDYNAVITWTLAEI